MLGQTYMNNSVNKVVTSAPNRRHTVNISDDVFVKLGRYIAKWGNTQEGIVNQAIYDMVCAREQFLKVFAPHLSLENATVNAIFINDHELNRIAVVTAKWTDISKESNNRSLLSLYCETCDSESCIHVRYSLVLPDVLRIRKEDKLV